MVFNYEFLKGCHTQHNDTQHNIMLNVISFMLSGTNKPFILNVVMPSVVVPIRRFFLLKGGFTRSILKCVFASTNLPRPLKMTDCSRMRGTLTIGEGSVQVTSSLSCLVL
jgi:hypothetical protein